MKRFTKGTTTLAILVAVALGASAVARAAGTGPLSSSDDNDDDVMVTGVSADRAGRAAVAFVGGGRAVEVEREDGGYEVEVRSARGRISDVEVNADFKATGEEIDDRDEADDDDDEDERDDD